MFYKTPAIEDTPESQGVTHSIWKISPSWMLTLPFILQVVTVVGWVGYVAHRNAQQSVENLTQQLLLVVSQRVEQKLSTYLEAPILANQNHSDAVRRGALNLDLSKDNNVQGEQYIWQQMNLFPNFSWISIGSEQGDCMGIWRPTENSPLQFAIVNPSTQHFGTYYATRAPGIRTQKLKVERPKFDPRTRPWYKNAIGSKESVWTPIYQGFTPGTIFIAASQALYDAEDRLRGVSGIDLSLTEIQRFLSKSKISPSGQIFLIERSGMLVSSSTEEAPFRQVNGKPVQIRAIDSETPLIRSTMRSLLNQVGDLQQIQALENIYFTDQGKYVRVVPFSRQKGLDWLIVMVIPESDVMGQIETGNQKTIILCLGALISVIALNSLIMRYLTEPIECLQSDNYKLHRLAYLDGLTQIPNRRSFDERLMQEWHRMKREQLPLVIILCDVDYFKKYNDTYGHQQGDECLCAVATAISAVVRRPADLAARYGGEEFVMLLPNTDLEGAIEVATAMRSEIHRLQIPHRSSEVNSIVTMSFGVASLIPQDPKNPEELLALADRALYEAKRSGRDRINTEIM